MHVNWELLCFQRLVWLSECIAVHTSRSVVFSHATHAHSLTVKSYPWLDARNITSLFYHTEYFSLCRVIHQSFVYPQTINASIILNTFIFQIHHIFNSKQSTKYLIRPLIFYSAIFVSHFTLFGSPSHSLQSIKSMAEKQIFESAAETHPPS